MPLRIAHVFAGIAVTDQPAALPWYERFFERPPDVAVSDRESRWRATETGWIFVVGDSARVGTSLATLLVDDPDAHMAALGKRGLSLPPVETAPGLYRRVPLTDPDGNAIMLGQSLNPSG